MLVIDIIMGRCFSIEGQTEEESRTKVQSQPNRMANVAKWEKMAYILDKKDLLMHKGRVKMPREKNSMRIQKEIDLETQYG